MNQTIDTSALSLLAFEDGFDPTEERLRANIRSTIEAVFQEELDSFLGRLRYRRGDGTVKGYRNGTRARQITGSFGTQTISVPRGSVLCFSVDRPLKGLIVVRHVDRGAHLGPCIDREICDVNLGRHHRPGA